MELIESSRTYRILVEKNEEPLLNMVYAELLEPIDAATGEGYEVFGAYSGMNGGGGLFHQNTDGEISVSDDCGEFNSKLSEEDVQKTCHQLEKLRAEFEDISAEGDMLGFSSAGLKFLSIGTEDDDGYLEVYSDGASEDFIYDVQDNWNLEFYKE